MGNDGEFPLRKPSKGTASMKTTTLDDKPAKILPICAKCSKTIKTAKILHCNIAMPVTYFHPGCYKKMQELHGKGRYPVTI
jgi:hypothetical protein